MKRIPTLLIILAISFIVFISCKKDPASNNNAVNPVTHDSIYLDSVIFVGYINPNDTLVTVYNYDSEKRVTSINSRSLVYDNHSSLTYSYNATDTVPFKLVTISKNSTDYDTLTTFYTYSSSNDVVKDSTFERYSNGSNYYQYYTTREYSVVPGKKYGFINTNYVYPSPFNQSSRDTATLDGSNNVISNKVYKPGTTPGVYEFYSNSVFTYDNKTNPASLLSNYKTLAQLPDNNVSNPYGYMSLNNLLSKTTTGTTSNFYNNIFTYTYNANGLPTVITGTNPSYPDTKYIYIYKSL